MPVANNPFDASSLALTRANQEDPLIMYYVVRKDRALTQGQAMSLAGAGAVACAEEWEASDKWAEAFTAWYAHSYRKVALRASTTQFERLAAEGDGTTLNGPDGRTLLCLPPRRKSDCEPLLKRLQVYTHAPFREPAPEPKGTVMRYVVRDGVMKSMGKMMAQAGHAALMCEEEFGVAYAHAFSLWRDNALAGLVLLGDDKDWQRVKTETDCVVVRDAGLTQVQAGTETVLALVPNSMTDPAVRSLKNL